MMHCRRVVLATLLLVVVAVISVKATALQAMPSALDTLSTSRNGPRRTSSSDDDAVRSDLFIRLLDQEGSLASPSLRRPESIATAQSQRTSSANSVSISKQKQLRASIEDIPFVEIRDRGSGGAEMAVRLTSNILDVFRLLRDNDSEKLGEAAERFEVLRVRVAYRDDHSDACMYSLTLKTLMGLFKKIKLRLPFYLNRPRVYRFEVDPYTLFQTIAYRNELSKLFAADEWKHSEALMQPLTWLLMDDTIVWEKSDLFK